jgi:nicotinate-nucleotide pyrophosphorylase (carboxylating)
MLNRFFVEEHVRKALEEDIGFGDITTDYLTDENKVLKCELNSRTEGVFCGKIVFETVFNVLSPLVKVTFYKNDGDLLRKNDKIADIEGPAKYVLLGERVALNYVQRMSGIATETKKYKDAIGDHKAKIVDTRKTTPLFRAFEKYSVKVGGGSLHRFNLSDCAMLKDNHIKYAGSLTKAVNILRKHLSHAHKIEVECDTIEQVKEAVAVGVDIIMLDNMSYDMMKECVDLINGKAIVEASGNVTLDTIKSIAATGVDIISSSAIVAKAFALDLGLDCKE